MNWASIVTNDALGCKIILRQQGLCSFCVVLDVQRQVYTVNAGMCQFYQEIYSPDFHGFWQDTPVNTPTLTWLDIGMCSIYLL